MTLQEHDHAHVFDEIYRKNVWLVGSGTGSTEHNTRGYRDFLHNFIRTNRISTVLDVGCGDWQIGRHIDWAGIDYVGIDVSAVVLTRTLAYARPGVRFFNMNAVTDQLPPADLLIAKDVLQHWSNADVKAFLAKLSQFRFALITNGVRPEESPMINSDITPGDWRPLDLRRAPFQIDGVYIAWFRMDEPKFAFLWMNTAQSIQPAALEV